MSKRYCGDAARVAGGSKLSIDEACAKVRAFAQSDLRKCIRWAGTRKELVEKVKDVLLDAYTDADAIRVLLPNKRSRSQLIQLLWHFRELSQEETDTLTGGPNVEGPEKLAGRRALSDMDNVLMKGPLGVTDWDAHLMFCFRTYDSMSHWRSLKKAYALLGRDWSSWHVMEANQGHISFGHLGGSVDVPSFCNPLKAVKLRAAVAAEFSDAAHMRPAVPAVHMLALQAASIISSMRKFLLRCRDGAGRHKRKVPFKKMCETQGAASLQGRFLTLVRSLFIISLQLSRLSRGADSQELCMYDMLFVMPAGSDAHSTTYLALAAVCPRLIDECNTYVERVWHGKDKGQFYRIDHHILPPALSCLSVPNTLAFLVRSYLVFAPHFLNPMLNTGLKVLPMLGEGGVMRASATDDMSRWLKDSVLQTDLQFWYRGYTLYSFRYGMAVELFKCGCLNCDPRILLLLRDWAGHDAKSDHLWKTYATCNVRALVTNRPKPKPKHNKATGLGSDDEGSDASVDEAEVSTLRVMSPADLWTQDEAFKMGAHFAKHIMSKLGTGHHLSF